MQNFVFSAPTQIFFGRGTEEGVGEAAKKQLGEKVLLHYGQSSIIKSGLKDRVCRSLRDAGVEVVELGGVLPNPRLQLVREGIELCRSQGVQGVLAIGGGSVIDSAKAMAMGVGYQGDVWDFFVGKAMAQRALPLGVVLTIPASGSEAGGGTVLTNEDGHLKRLAWSEHVIPRFAIMNPELTFTLPAYQTACGGADIIAHVLERYFTNVREVDLTDRLCEAVLRSVIVHLPVVLEEPENYGARAEIMWAGTVAHNGFLDVGRLGDWACHSIEHELSGLYDVPHGAGLAVLLPAWMRYVLEHDRERFQQFAKRVWQLDKAEEGIQALAGFFRRLNLPGRLSELGIDDARFLELARKCTGNGTLKVGNFVPLDTEDIVAILEMAK
ncbi:MAG: iron-containing alcohol dehydrogenase [Bacillota bacterium]|jgi:alcohol dehydrogenase YqhD (iron-dependent ADH family)|nr:iron-containing alcohol dehydrogenase [Bacillota bacterium]HHT91540.1 iron-containing alcohol dehydrogenase [Bacillota bacterium]